MSSVKWHLQTLHPLAVIPDAAKRRSGIHLAVARMAGRLMKRLPARSTGAVVADAWIPAFAGMTVEGETASSLATRQQQPTAVGLE